MGQQLGRILPSSIDVTVNHSPFDNPNDLPAKIVIDSSNVIVCQAAANPSGDTVIVLITHKDALTRRLDVTSNSSFARTILCGQRHGIPMKTPNEDMKMTAVNFGKDVVVAIQLLKQMQPDRICSPVKPTDLGMMMIPHALKGHLIVFMWPDAYPGVGGNHSQQRQQSVTLDGEKDNSRESDVPECALKVDEDAQRLLRVFNL